MVPGWTHLSTWVVFLLLLEGHFVLSGLFANENRTVVIFS